MTCCTARRKDSCQNCLLNKVVQLLGAWITPNCTRYRKHHTISFPPGHSRDATRGSSSNETRSSPRNARCGRPGRRLRGCSKTQVTPSNRFKTTEARFSGQDIGYALEPGQPGSHASFCHVQTGATACFIVDYRLVRYLQQTE
jgi:hypothetical protein